MKNMYLLYLNNKIELLIEDKEVLDREIKMAMNKTKTLINMGINRMNLINMLKDRMILINMDLNKMITININNPICQKCLLHNNLDINLSLYNLTILLLNRILFIQNHN